MKITQIPFPHNLSFKLCDHIIKQEQAVWCQVVFVSSYSGSINISLMDLAHGRGRKIDDADEVVIEPFDRREGRSGNKRP